MKKAFRILSVMVVMAMLLGACAPATAVPPTQAPVQPTKAAVAATATQVPVQPTKAPDPTKVPPTAEPTKAPVKPVVVANASDITTLDPGKFSGMFNRSVGYWIFDCLVMNDRQGKPMPELAKEWKRVDPLTWELKLVQNAKFHNGEPFNAAAVKYSFDRMALPENISFNTLHLRGYLKEVKIIDDYTIQLVTEKPSEDMMWHLAQAFIVAPKYYAEHDAAFLVKNPIGTGPYKFVEWVKDNRVVVTANPDYFQGPAKIKDIIVRIIPEASSRLNELKVGNVDLVTTISGDIASQANSANSRLVSFQSLRKMFVGIQLGKDGPEPFKKLEVRQAMNYAIDRKSIIDAYLLGNSSPLVGVVNPPNTSPNIKGYTYDPAKAKELLTKAGYPNGFEVTLQTQTAVYGADKEICQVIKQNLEQVGIKVKLEVIEAAKFTEVHQGKNFPGLLYFGLGTYNVPTIELNTFTCGYVDNSFNYCNQDFEKALTEMSITSDPAKRMTLSNKAEEIVWNDVPWVYLWHLTYFLGMSNRFQYEPYLDNYIDMWQASLK
jgi:peptide/nickel transport system substrate-binding protein